MRSSSAWQITANSRLAWLLNLHNVQHSCDHTLHHMAELPRLQVGTHCCQTHPTLKQRRQSGTLDSLLPVSRLLNKLQL